MAGSSCVCADMEGVFVDDCWLWLRFKRCVHALLFGRGFEKVLFGFLCILGDGFGLNLLGGSKLVLGKEACWMSLPVAVFFFSLGPHFLF